ncbi:reprolysin-like metallopeptidase [Blastococcus sp. SYSU DS0539]
MALASFGVWSSVPSGASADDGAPAPAVAETLVGTLVQAWPEPEHGHEFHDPAESRPLSWIRTDAGDTVRVATDDVAEIPVGSTVEVVVGETVAEQTPLAAELEPAREVLETEILEAAATETLAPASAPFTNQLTVALVAPAGAAPDDTTADQVLTTLNGAVADFWEEQSGGTIRIGATAPRPEWLRSTAGCDDPYALWDDAAAQVGFTPGPGKHLLLYLPGASGTLPGCAYGLAEVRNAPGAGGYLYVQAAATSVIAHELGHNFGLGHSAERQCDTTLEYGTCRTVTYGDLYDVMGGSWEQIGSLNAPQADRIGLLAAAQVQTVVAGTPGSVTVALSPVSGRTGTRAVELVDPDGVVYWLEFRPASGRDGYLGTDANWLGLEPGVLLRRSAGPSDTSVLFDPTSSPRAAWDTDTLQALPVGQVVRISGGDFAVSVESVTATSASVRIATQDATTTPISQTYADLDGPGGPLGAPTGEETCGLAGGGCSRTYENGDLYWNPAGRVHAVLGPLAAEYAAVGGPAVLGYPTGDTTATTGGGGASSVFERGVIAWSPATGAHAVRGAVLARWRELGAQTGPWGYPLAGEQAVPGGVVARFAGGTVYWSAGTGPQLVRGAILARYEAAGGPPALGFPVADEGGTADRTGALVRLERAVIYWSPASGAQVVKGAVRARWVNSGAQTGPLRYPVGAEVCGLRGGGCVQNFQGGTLYWSPATGAQPVTGAIRGHWGQLGWENGYLGYPVAAEVCGLRGGGCVQNFQGGTLYWSPATGAQPVKGAIRARWEATGWENGYLGYPVAAEVCGLRDGGCVQNFQGGTLYWSPMTGAQPVNGAIRSRYGQLGWENGYLGYPVGPGPVPRPNGDEYQRFQGGMLYWSATTGQVRAS